MTTSRGNVPKIDVTQEPDAIVSITAEIGGGSLPDLFVREGKVITAQMVDGKVSDGQVGSGYTIEDIGPDNLRALLANHADTFKVVGSGDKRREIPTLPSPQTCKAILAQRTWPGVRPLLGLVTAPVLRPDGSILQTPGYDEATALFYEPAIDMTPVPDVPDVVDVKNAKELLLDHVLPDFSWAGPADRANYLALLMSPIIRPYAGGLIPLGAVSAAERGSGKTLLTTIIGKLFGATVRPWVSDESELRKAITATLSTTNPVISFDNVGETDTVSAPVLAKLLTSSIWDDRMLGTSREVRLINDRLWLVTGNSIRFGGDIAQRTVLVHLDPKCPRPDQRTGFQIPDLEEWLEDPANRAELLRALLILARSWIVAGAQREEFAMRGFRRWACAMGGFLAHHGITGFLGNREQLEEHDDEAEVWAAFLSTWHSKFGTAPQTAHELRKSAEKAWTPLGGEDDPWHGNFITRADGTLPTPRGLGMILKSRRDRFFGRFSLKGTLDSSSNVWCWYPEPYVAEEPQHAEQAGEDWERLEGWQ